MAARSGTSCDAIRGFALGIVLQAWRTATQSSIAADFANLIKQPEGQTNAFFRIEELNILTLHRSQA